MPDPCFVLRPRSAAPGLIKQSINTSGGTHLAVVDVDLTARAGEPLLALARVGGHAVHARGARRARGRLAFVDVDRTIFT